LHENAITTQDLDQTTDAQNLDNKMQEIIVNDHFITHVTNASPSKKDLVNHYQADFQMKMEEMDQELRLQVEDGVTNSFGGGTGLNSPSDILRGGFLNSKTVLEPTGDS